MKKICYMVTEIYAIKTFNPKLLSNSWRMDEQRDERKDLQMAKWAEGLNVYIPEILCMPYV